MRGPYGFNPIEACESCELRDNSFFCQLPPAALKELNTAKTTTLYPDGAVLFLENQQVRGVYLLCAGNVKLTISSSSGKTLILRIAKPGEILGLMSALTNSPYEVTAECLHPCQVSFIRTEEFLRLVAKHPEMQKAVVRQLSQLYSGVCEQLRTVALSASVPEKLARLLLTWSSEGRKTTEGTQVTVPLTHEEIAEFLGTTRETVTRTLGDFKLKNLVSLRGSTLTIANRAALESFASA